LEEDEVEAMKILRNLLFALFAVAGLTLSVSAQKDDKKRPPKDPPKVEPADKNKPRENPPPRDNRPKKPGMEFVLVIANKKTELA
jgi:hypothetical protein